MKRRPYQIAAKRAAFRDWNKGHRSTLFVCPTGGGKSWVFSDVAAAFVRKHGGRVLILAAQDWLVGQARKNIAQHTSLTVGIEMARQRVDRAAPPQVVCASVQSMHRRLADFAPDAFGLIIIDEADLALAPSYRKVVDHFESARIFGCTATPDRNDELPLGDLFDSVCLSVDIGDLIRAGHLAPIRQRSVKVLDLSLAKTRDGDFTEASLERILTEERHLHEVVKPTLDLHRGRPTLVFATSVKHAEALTGVFNRYRPGSARSVRGEAGAAGKARNRETIDAFLRGDFPILCNCALLLRGVDLPPVACIAMARPTQSRALYTQSLGRGTRLHPGKADCLVLDFGDNASTHSLVTAIDILGGKRLEETRERAREILEAEPDGDVLDTLALAEEQLAADGELRARVIARVKYRTKARGDLGIDWDAQPLGTMSDVELARKLGIPLHHVWRQRVSRGIPPFTPPNKVDWASQPLGKVPDVEIAQRLGLSLAAVGRHRKRLGIDRFHAVRWDLQPLGSVSDGEIAESLGIDRRRVTQARRSRGIRLDSSVAIRRPDVVARVDWSLQPLGRMTDAAIAESLGLAVHNVRRVRRSMEIPSQRKRVVIDWETQPLGKCTDKAIAESLGVSVGSVRRARVERGIRASRFND